MSYQPSENEYRNEMHRKQTMSTDSPIPERWRTPCPICKGSGSVDKFGFANALHMDSGEPEKMVRKSCHACKGKGWLMPSVEDVLGALGTAESRVRDLAGALNKADFFLSHSGNQRSIVSDNYQKPSGRWKQFQETKAAVKEALSRIPAHLRAPETTSTGESSTVLRKEESHDH